MRIILGGSASQFTVMVREDFEGDSFKECHLARKTSWSCIGFSLDEEGRWTKRREGGCTVGSIFVGRGASLRGH